MADGMGVPSILWEPKVHYWFDTTPLLVLVLSQMNLILIFGTRLTWQVASRSSRLTPFT